MNKLLKQVFKTSYDFKKGDITTRDVSSMRLSIIGQAKNTYMKGYTTEDIEDALMDAVMYVWERCKRDEAYAKSVTISSITFKMREFATRAKRKDNGYTQRGTVPIGGRRPYVQNKYDEFGDNVIEKIGYDYKGDIIVGS